MTGPMSVRVRCRWSADHRHQRAGYRVAGELALGAIGFAGVAEQIDHVSAVSFKGVEMAMSEAGGQFQGRLPCLCELAADTWADAVRAAGAFCPLSDSRYVANPRA